MAEPPSDSGAVQVTVAEAFERGEARAYGLDEIAVDQGDAEVICDALEAVDTDVEGPLENGQPQPHVKPSEERFIFLVV